MGLGDIIEFIRSREKQLVLFNISEGDSINTELAAYFDTQNVRITTERTGSGTPTEIAVLSNEESVLAVVSVSTLRELLEDDHGSSRGIGIADGEYEPILGHLKETTFTSYDRTQLLYASREIEDRARRASDGTIHTGFQKLSVMAGEQPIYSDLAHRGVEIHAYGVPDSSPPDFASGQIHAVETDEIAEMWFVVFDGGTDTTQKTALLAKEIDAGRFYGAWTYDTQIVDYVLDYLERTYLAPVDDTRSPTTD